MSKINFILLNLKKKKQNYIKAIEIFIKIEKRLVF